MTSAPDDNGDDGRRREPEIEEAFDRLVSEGGNRLERPLVPLLATGLFGGIDVGLGVFAYLVVEQATGNRCWRPLAFPIGFIALLLARSELFTENFLVPVVAANRRPRFVVAAGAAVAGDPGDATGRRAASWPGYRRARPDLRSPWRRSGITTRPWASRGARSGWRSWPASSSPC